MAFRQEPPQSFQDAYELAQKLIARNKNIQTQRALELESESLVSHAYAETSHKKLSRVELFSRMKDRFPQDAGEKLIVLAMSRAEGIPLQYILGKAAFIDDIFSVKKGVFIPRPETELLVSIAQEDIEGLFKADSCGMEVGLGSGVISLSLLRFFPKLQMVASEWLDVAAEVAMNNAKELKVESRLKILRPKSRSDVLDSFKLEVIERKRRFDFLISNPPYVSKTDLISEDVLRYEPHEALFPEGESPTYFYDIFAKEARELITSTGKLYLEVPHQRAELIAQSFSGHGWGCSLHLDLTGRQRFLLARRLS
jgi:release factor glutamine methyltransferase